MDPEENSNPLVNLYLPAALIALALGIFFFSQIKGAGQGMKAMKWQNNNADQQISKLKESRDKLTKAIEERKPLVEQSEETQKQFTELMTEVDLLARGGDKDAKLIIEGYKVTVNAKTDAKGADGGKKDDKSDKELKAEPKAEKKP